MYLTDFPVVGEPSKYAFANACLAIMENRLLTQSQIDQLRVADSMREFERMLSDTVYIGYLEDKLPIGEIVERELIRTRQELYEILPSEVIPYFDVFYRKFDYNNLKILLKARLLGRPHTERDLSRAGTIDPAELYEYFVDEKFDELPFPIDVEALDSEVRRKWELRIVDAEVDKAYYKEYLNKLKSLGDPIITDAIKQEIDLKNILIFVRCIKAGISPDRYFLEGGYISPETFMDNEGEGIDVIMTKSDFVEYRSIIAKGLSSLEKTGSYSDLETAIRNYLVWLLAEVRDHFFTIRPFIRFLIAKFHEINVLKKLYIHVKEGLEFGLERDRVYV